MTISSWFFYTTNCLQLWKVLSGIPEWMLWKEESTCTSIVIQTSGHAILANNPLLDYNLQILLDMLLLTTQCFLTYLHSVFIAWMITRVSPLFRYCQHCANAANLPCSGEKGFGSSSNHCTPQQIVIHHHHTNPSTCEEMVLVSSHSTQGQHSRIASSYALCLILPRVLIKKVTMSRRLL